MVMDMCLQVVVKHCTNVVLLEQVFEEIVQLSLAFQLRPHVLEITLQQVWPLIDVRPDLGECLEDYVTEVSVAVVCSICCVVQTESVESKLESFTLKVCEIVNQIVDIVKNHLQLSACEDPWTEHPKPNQVDWSFSIPHAFRHARLRSRAMWWLCCFQLNLHNTAFSQHQVLAFD